MEEQQQKQGLGVPAEDSRRAIRSNSSPETGCGISTSIPNAGTGTVGRTRAVIKEQIAACESSIDALQAERKELLKENLLLCDDEQRYAEKVETITFRDGRKRTRKQCLVGRVYWKETFVDEDTGIPLTIERSQAVRIDGVWE